MSRQRQLGFLVVLVALLASAGWGQAGDKAAPQAVSVHVDSVLAADTHEGMDTRLTAMSGRLKALFDYSTYRLVSRQDKKTACGQMAAFTLPGGRILHVAPRDVTGDMVTMELVLFQGERPMMSTDLKIPNHGVLILGGPRYQQGMLIVFVSADSPGPSTPERRAAPTTPVSSHH